MQTITFAHGARKGLMTALLAVTPLVFIGAECANEITEPPLAQNTMRAEITTEGNFASAMVEIEDRGNHWYIKAEDDANSDIHIEIDVPKKATVPYTIDLSKDEVAELYYCIPLTSTSCKNFYASKARGGSGTLTVTKISGNLEGTFNGTVTTVTSNPETRTITNGRFNVRL